MEAHKNSQLRQPHKSPFQASDNHSSTRVREIMERHLLYDLAEVSARVCDSKAQAAVTGGMAARAYTGPTRFTHDVDIVVSRESYPKLKHILKGIGYRTKMKTFGHTEALFASKCIDDRAQGLAYNLEFHACIGGVFDHSSGIFYPATERLFMDSRTLPVRGYYQTSANIITSAQVVGLEDLFLLKMLTRSLPENGREKDTLDTLLIALKNPPDATRLWTIARSSCVVGIENHLKSQLDSKLREGMHPDFSATLSKYNVQLSADNWQLIQGVFAMISAHQPTPIQ